MQTIPKPKTPSGLDSRSELHGQRPVTGPRDVFAQLLFIRREDADTTSPARDGHIPLLRVRGGLDSGVREEDIIHRLPLRTVRRYGVAGEELPEILVQYPAICEVDSAIGSY